MTDSLIIWQFSDQKLGHENQAKGLINELKTHRSVDTHKIVVPTSCWSLISSIISGSLYRQLNQLPKPSHLIAVGRRTHIPMLLAHQWFGGARIVLMRSFWPHCWFDHQIIPAHDAPSIRPNVLKTQGAINTVTPSDTHNQQSGLILLGGPSKHYHWNTTQVIDQITELVHAYPDINWQIANSRRSPIDLFKQIENVLPDISLIDVNTVDNHWLPAQLATAGQVWVSPDSVSMVYESLTSGATVGSFILEKKGKKNRVVGGINLLIETNMLTSFDQWQLSHQLTPPPQQLNEAQRAADWILNQ